MYTKFMSHLLTKRISPLWLIVAIFTIFLLGKIFSSVFVDHLPIVTWQNTVLFGTMLIVATVMGLKANSQLFQLGDAQASARAAKFYTWFLAIFIAFYLVVGIIGYFAVGK